MHLDFDTLLYAGLAMAMLAAAVVSFFGATQTTHPGFRAWIVAQWLLVAGLLLDVVFGAHAVVAPLVALLIVQWPLVVLSGMRLLHARKRPWLPPAADWCLLALAAAVLVSASAAEVGTARNISAFTLCAFVVTLYSAIVVSRLGDFKRNFALKALFAMEASIAAVEAACLGLASGGNDAAPHLDVIRLVAHLAAVCAALGLVPIALALTYERTVVKMQATHRKLRHLADIDVLTRLPNRRHFHELATRTLTSSEPAAAAVLMFDIENLKRINDLLGPACGDEALRQVGLVLRETLRARDVAGRVGGDEFAALLPETSVADAVRVSDRILQRLEDRQVAPRTARLTLNVGAVQLRAGDSIVEAMRRADAALDDARRHRHGRPNRIEPVERTVTLGPAPDLEPRAG